MSNGKINQFFIAAKPGKCMPNQYFLVKLAIPYSKSQIIKSILVNHVECRLLFVEEWNNRYEQFNTDVRKISTGLLDVDEHKELMNLGKTKIPFLFKTLTEFSHLPQMMNAAENQTGN